jgi:tRNA pseudouridine13 synthase
MKIKCRPEDFIVEELPVDWPDRDGGFVLYRLEKMGIGTFEAIEQIRRAWNLAPDQVQYGGLKDRHALTIQYLTIARGPERGLTMPNFELMPIGRSQRPWGPASFRGNRFELILRDLSPEEVERASKMVQELPVDGVANYFDDQRFGSVGYSGEFIGEAWVKGDHERALWLAIAEENSHDRPEDRGVKEVLRESWKNWAAAKEKLPKSHERSLVTYLVDHPEDFRGAFARLRRDMRSIYFSAYQSYLWNRLLGGLIERITEPEQRINYPFRTGPLPLPRGLSREQGDKLAETDILFPASRNPEPEGILGEVAKELMESRGGEWPALRVKYLKDVFFSKGSRAATFDVAELDSSLGADQLYPGKMAMWLAFELPRGAYATLVVKRITSQAGSGEEPEVAEELGEGAEG